MNRLVNILFRLDIFKIISYGNKFLNITCHNINCDAIGVVHYNMLPNYSNHSYDSV